MQIFAYLRLDSAVREKMRQGEFCNKDGMKAVGFPVKGKGRAWGARPDGSSGRLGDCHRNLRAMNQGSGDGGDGEGVGTRLGIGRAAGAGAGGASACRGVSAAPGSG